MSSKRLGTTCLISASLAFFGLFDVPVIAQQPQPSAMGQLAKKLGQAIESLTKQKPAKPAAPAFDVVELVEIAVPAVADADVNKRLTRLQSHSDVLLDWIKLSVDLSEQQTQQLDATLSTTIAQSQTAWRKGGDGNTAVQDDYLPLNFTDADGPARNLDRVAMEAVEHSAKLSEATAEREAFYREAALGYVLNLLDEALFLTPDQRKQMRDIVAKKVDLNAACFSVLSQAQARRYVQYFQTISVTTAMSPDTMDNVLSPNQKLLAEDLTSDLNIRPYFSIKTGDDSETQLEALKSYTATQRLYLNRNLAIQIDFHHSTSGLSDKQVRYLKLAGKGAMDDVMRTWKSNTTKTIERYKTQQFAGQNVSVGISAVTIRQLMDNPLWAQTLESVVAKDSKAARNRRAVQKAARAKFAVALLDRELWLEPFQRERLLTSVEKTLSSLDSTANQRRNTNEISLLCTPLFKLSKLDLTILSPAQRTVWKGIKDLFTLSNNYARVKTKRRGTISIRLSD